MTTFSRIILVLFFITKAMAADHHVFLIHGVGSDSAAFVNTEKVLLEKLNKADDQTDFKIVTFDYPTGSDEHTTYDFAKLFATFTNDYFVQNKMGPQDKFSVLGYSQGGLVALNWMLHSFLHEKGFSKLSLLEKMDSYITLATPFWGTNIVRFPIVFDYVTNDRFRLPVGEKEIRDMRYGSFMIDKFLNVFTNDEHPFKKFLKNKVRVLNIVGWSTWVPGLATGSRRVSSDTTVPVASAHLNFHYSKSSGHNKIVPLEYMQEKSVSPFVLAKAAHVTLPFTYGIANFPTKCIDEQCGHPAVSYVLDHLLGKEIKQKNSKVVTNNKSFVINMRLNISLLEDKKQGEFKKNDFSFIFLNSQGGVLAKKKIKIYKKQFYYRRTLQQDNEFVRYDFYFVGKINDKQMNKKNLRIIVSTNRNVNAKILEIMVQKNYFSIVDTTF